LNKKKGFCCQRQRVKGPKTQTLVCETRKEAKSLKLIRSERPRGGACKREDGLSDGKGLFSLVTSRVKRKRSPYILPFSGKVGKKEENGARRTSLEGNLY